MGLLSGFFGSFMKQASPIEKVMKNSCFTKESFEEVEYEDLIKVLSFLNGSNEINSLSAARILFTYIKEKKDLSVQRRMKFLALIHKAIKKLGFEFAEEFFSQRLIILRERQTATGKNNTPPIKAAKKSNNYGPNSSSGLAFHYLDMETWLDEYVVKHYYDYLLRLSLNLDTFKECQEIIYQSRRGISREENFHEPVVMNYGQQQRILVLFKVSNLVNFIMRLHKHLSVIFTEFKFIAVAKDLGYMVLKDCVMYYNAMHLQIMNMVANYEGMVENDQMQFYELFIELIKLNSALHEFGKLRKFFDDDESIEQLMVLNITKERARQIDRNHRKIVLKNNELQKQKKLELSQQGPHTDRDRTVTSKRFGMLNKQNHIYSGSMTARGSSSTWNANDLIREVTNDDEEEEVNKPIGDNLPNRKRPGVLSLAGNNKEFIEINIENFTTGKHIPNSSTSGGIRPQDGFHTDRVFSRSPHDDADDKSDSTKDTKKDDTEPKADV